MRIFRPAQAPLWLENVLQSIERAVALRWSSPVMLQSFTKTTMPDPADWIGGIIYVTNDVGGATVAFSDGTNWRRAADRNVIS